MFHYIYIFVAQFCTLVVYTGLIVRLLLQRSRIRREISSTRTSRSIKRAAYYMAVYPAVSLVLWMPSAVARMLLYAGHGVPQMVLLVGGILVTCCGWVNALVYIITRRVFVPERSGLAPQYAREGGHHHPHEDNHSLGTSPARQQQTNSQRRTDTQESTSTRSLDVLP